MDNREESMNDESLEQQARKRRGRRYSEIRASTEEYARLVGFLRRQLNRAGLRQTDLAKAIGVSESAISERLQGTKLTLDFVEAVVEACASTPHLALRRDKDLAEARRLWALTQRTQTPVLRLADQPAPIRKVAVEAQRRTLEAQDKIIDLQDELIRKQEQLSLTERARRRSEQALFAATALAGLLSAWVIVLADEVEQLTRERDESMQVQPPDLSRLAALDPELAMKTMQEQRTSTELRKVEQEREIAQAVLILQPHLEISV
ncbi:helix-turn-helix domain-containing protein [Spirillospora sp. CA-142024]|uniref:helix-turn-helix domain-containing protein n=1 Tax=Spirillospora sp. CA-142024 TaxID=3240036 RepID=UPI003D8D2793